MIRREQHSDDFTKLLTFFQQPRSLVEAGGYGVFFTLYLPFAPIGEFVPYSTLEDLFEDYSEEHEG